MTHRPDVPLSTERVCPSCGRTFDSERDGYFMVGDTNWICIGCPKLDSFVTAKERQRVAEESKKEAKKLRTVSVHKPGRMFDNDRSTMYDVDKDDDGVWRQL